MVTSTRTASRLMIVAQPNQSASCQANMLVLLALAIPSLGIAIVFALRGAWPILPFAGLELLALASALYYVKWKQQYRHVITVSADSVRIDKGFYTPRDSWQFSRQQAGLCITPERHPWDGPEVYVHDRHDRVVLGEFLSREDSLQLVSLLKSEIRLRSDSPGTERGF